MGIEMVDRTYRIVTALRGPDFDCNMGATMKWALTARLRGITFNKEEAGLGSWRQNAFNDSDLAQLTKALNKEAEELTVEQARSMYHYIDHTIDAILETRRHRIWNGMATRILDLLDQTITILLRKL